MMILKIIVSTANHMIIHSRCLTISQRLYCKYSPIKSRYISITTTYKIFTSYYILTDDQNVRCAKKKYSCCQTVEA